MISAITSLDRRFGWSFLGFVLAIFFGGLSIYTEFFKNSAPLVEFELLSNTPVLDVRENLPELEVLYQKQDIAKSGQTLSVLLVRIVNHGSANLVANDYDAKAPLGLALEGATLIRAELTSTSNGYLGEVTGVHVRADGVVAFDPVILEPGEWYLVKLLALHKTQSQPALATRGKIAGMHEPPQLVTVPNEPETFWERTFSGGVWTQIVRMVVYFFALLVGALAVVLPFAAVESALTTRKRRKVVTRFKVVKKLPAGDSDNVVFTYYINEGIRGVKRMARVLRDSDLLQKRATDYVKWRDSRSLGVALDHEELDIDELRADELREVAFTEASQGAGLQYYIRSVQDIGPLLKAGFIKETDGQWSVDPKQLQIVESFIEYVELVGASGG